MGPDFRRAFPAAPILLAALLGACADRNPTAAVPGVAPAPAALAMLLCTADVKAAAVTCRDGSPRAADGQSADLIVGTPYVHLTSSGVSYDSGTQIFRFDVTLQNLMSQAIGTTDGVTAAPQGIRVFFHSGPTVTQGSGVATVANADGTAAFTAANQPYFRYDAVLAPNATSQPKQWDFTVSATVIRFDFMLYVSVPVQNEAGRVDVLPSEPEVLPGGHLPLVTVVRNGAGRRLPGAHVAWASSDTLVATVDSAGVVTGVSLGQAIITATSGARSGTATVTVNSTDTQDASLLDFSLSADSLDLSSGVDSVEAVLELADGGVGVGAVYVIIENGEGDQHICSALRTAGSDVRGTWRCPVVVSPYGANGEYDVVISLQDGRGHMNIYSAADLADRGLDHGLFVSGAVPDRTAPQLTGFTITPDSVDVDTAGAVVELSASVSDAGSGVGEVTLVLDSPTYAQERSCAATRTAGTASAGTWACSISLPEDVEGGAWTTGMRLTDAKGNFVDLFEAELQAQGFPTHVQVTSPNADVTPPSISAFSFTPDSVDIAAGAANVTFSLTVSDVGSGVEATRVLLSAPSLQFAVTCDGALTSGTAASGTWTCSVQIPQFAETGEWVVTSVSTRDALGNSVELDASELQTAGFPTRVTVTH